MFPSQVAWLCRHADLNKYNLDSVLSIAVGGARMIPDHEKEIIAKLPNLKMVVIVSHRVAFKNAYEASFIFF